MSSEAKINTLCQKKIYLSSPFSFNDRFDCQIHASDELYKNILNESNRSVSDDEVFNLKLSINSLINKIRIACFSRKDPLHTNSINMWGLYGDKGKGIAVSYNFADLLLLFCNYFQKGDENKSIEDVEYSVTHKPSKIIQNLIQYVFKYSEASNTMKSFYNGMAENELHNLILTKSSTWEHEEELRFSFLTDYSLVKEEFDSIKTSTKQDEVIQELIKKVLKIAIYEDFIKPSQIILGWDCEKNNAEIIKLCAYCKNNAIPIIKLQGYIDYENDKLM